MLFKEFGDKNLPVILLLHGGGLSWWSLRKAAEELQPEYHVVLPVIDGHGEDGQEAFISIEESAKKLIRYIDDNHNGKVYAIGGLSLGAQITVEVLSRRENIADYAVIESALVFPIKGSSAMAAPAYSLFYGLIKRKWFSKIQSKSLFVPENQFELYYEDSMKMSKESLINIAISNGSYKIKESLRSSGAKVLIIAGEKELGVMKKSAEALRQTIPGSESFIALKMGHGEISMVHTEKYVDLMKTFFRQQK